MKIPGLKIGVGDRDLPWQETRVPGIAWLPLFEATTPGSESGPRDTTALIRMAPGCGYPAHRHLDVEEVLVLAGGYADERGTHGAGTYLRYEAGSVHTPVAVGDAKRPVSDDNPACVLYAVARGGVELLRT